MAKFDGLPLRAAIAKIGEPIDERTTAGRRVYIWGTLGTVKPGDKEKCQITATMTLLHRSITKVMKHCASDMPQGCDSSVSKFPGDRRECPAMTLGSLCMHLHGCSPSFLRRKRCPLDAAPWSFLGVVLQSLSKTSCADVMCEMRTNEQLASERRGVLWEGR